MKTEMLSGPDMGGGFLYQLTRETERDPTRFVFHAQDGGADAGGPPAGTPEPFGYFHPAQSCDFGGPRCWHREFELPSSDAARARAGYNRTRFVMQAMLAQRYANEEVPVEEALRDLLDRVGSSSGPEERPWWVGGSTSLWLRGLGPRPHDLDLGVTDAGAGTLGAALEEYLIEPLGPVVEADGRTRVGARAFLGTHRRGVCVEWAVADTRSPPEFRARVARQAGEFSWEGRSVPIAPLELSLAGAASRGDATTWDGLFARLGSARLDPGVLEQGLTEAGVVAQRADQLRSLAEPAYR
ncbi:MAG: hypothetical protein L3K23_08705 [Thermoplasmata archaeon]|nr:hypothetical protein [Thermoplasmata archaeon]